MNTSISYSDYNSLVNTLQSSSHENTYQEMISKESKTLDTMNNVIKYYRDTTIADREFINQPIRHTITRFFSIWMEIINEISDKEVDSIKKVLNILTREDRLIYIGIAFVFLSGILFYIEITRTE